MQDEKCREQSLGGMEKQGRLRSDDTEVVVEETACSNREVGDASVEKPAEGSVGETRAIPDAPAEKRIGPFSRRSFVIGAGSTVLLLGLGGLRYAGHNSVPRPPGGQDEKYLVSACIRCERCYEVCPHRAIIPAKIEDGLLGMRTPMLDFDAHNYCDFCYEENGGIPLCVSVCPTHALHLDDDYEVGNPEEKTRGNVVIGKAVIDTSTCLAYRLTACRTCYDVCQYGAITLLNDTAQAVNPLPVVHEDLCNGCGHCQAECLSLTTGSVKSDKVAIVVEPA